MMTVPDRPPAHGTPSRAFGRRAVPDPRDLHHLLYTQFPPEGIRTGPPQVRYQRGPLYDERTQPRGVACALLSALHAGPGRIGPTRCPTPTQLYDEARRIEGALGREITLRAGCKALQRWGLITHYAWTYDVDEIADYLGQGQGGLVLGLDWYSGMSQPDPTGLLRAWGPYQGGHAVFVWGLEYLRQTVLLQNNWGTEWGGWSTRAGRRDFQGCARLPLEDLKKLLSDNGEAVVLTKNPSWKRFT